MSETRVAFFLGQVAWLGGVNYFRSLLTAIQSVPELKIRPIVIAGLKSDINEFEDLAEVIRTPLLDRYTLGWWVSKCLNRAFSGRDYLLYFFLRRHRIDLISHNCLLWKGCKIPSIGWIPDFQHLHLPGFFDKKECKARNSQFKNIIHRSNAVILSSQDALNDLNRFCGHNKTPTHILRFVSSPHQHLDELPSREELTAKYSIDRPWFYIPNQFWAHKNHTVVVEALHLLKKHGDKFLVVATGNIKDIRNKGYFPSLMKKVTSYGLQEDFRPLGVLPYSDVFALMFYSVAVINPSLFEGWSTSVEEAKSLGKVVILSDISVHQEQKPKRGYYFSPHDQNMLLNIMKTVMQNYDKKIEEDNYTKAQAKHILNREHFARQFESVCLKLTCEHSK